MLRTAEPIAAKFAGTSVDFSQGRHIIPRMWAGAGVPGRSEEDGQRLRRVRSPPPQRSTLFCQHTLNVVH